MAKELWLKYKMMQISMTPLNALSQLNTGCFLLLQDIALQENQDISSRQYLLPVPSHSNHKGQLHLHPLFHRKCHGLLWPSCGIELKAFVARAPTGLLIMLSNQIMDPASFRYKDAPPWKLRMRVEICQSCTEDVGEWPKERTLKGMGLCEYQMMHWDPLAHTLPFFYSQ